MVGEINVSLVVTLAGMISIGEACGKSICLLLLSIGLRGEKEKALLLRWRQCMTFFPTSVATITLSIAVTLPSIAAICTEGRKCRVMSAKWPYVLL